MQPNVDSEDAALAELRRELSSLKLSALKRRARDEGVDEKLLESADDAADVRAAVCQLIVESVGDRGWFENAPSDIDITENPLSDVVGATDRNVAALPQARNGESNDGHRADIDGLRAVAVAGVVIFHMSPEWLPGGFTGVDIFFVISGFVVTGSLLRPRKQSTSVGGDFLAFYSRRVKRLTPALACATLVSSLMAVVVVPPYNAELDDYLSSAQVGLLGWVNMFYAANKGAGEAVADYFGNVQFRGLDWNFFTHYWSLSVEEQFYFCYPMLLLLAAGRQRVNVLSTLSHEANRTAEREGDPSNAEVSKKMVSEHSRLLTVVAIRCVDKKCRLFAKKIEGHI
eukprot:SAG31_NODE_6323_length_2066_cov_2.036604_1_plen_342_part_00